MQAWRRGDQRLRVGRVGSKLRRLDNRSFIVDQLDLAEGKFERLVKLQAHLRRRRADDTVGRRLRAHELGMGQRSRGGNGGDRRG